MRTWDGSDYPVTANELAHPRRPPAPAAEPARRQNAPAARGRSGPEHHATGPAEAVPLMTEPQEAELRAAAERAWAHLVAGETAAAFAAAWPRIRAELLK